MYTACLKINVLFCASAAKMGNILRKLDMCERIQTLKLTQERLGLKTPLGFISEIRNVLTNFDLSCHCRGVRNGDMVYTFSQGNYFLLKLF